MKYATTDYLFILSLYDEAIPLSRLLFHLDSNGKAQRTAYLQAKADLHELKKINLVALRTQDGVDMVRLTPLGRQTAETVAYAMSETMVNDWQLQTLQSSVSYARPA